MKHTTFVFLMLACATCLSAATPGQHANANRPANSNQSMTADGPMRQARIADVILDGALPVDLTAPEGKTRWDLTSLRRRAAFVRSLGPDADGGMALSDGCFGRAVYTDTDGVSVNRWLMPDGDREKLRPGTRETIDLYEARGGGEHRLRIDTEIVGIGWVHLPSGPHEAVLQRAQVRGGAAGDMTVYRWIDPREGVVAEASGAARIEQAMVQEQMLLGAANLVLYVDDLDGPPLKSIGYGWNRGNGTTVASLTPGNYATIGNLLAANTWDFSGNTTGTEIASTAVPQSAAETCNINSCGYNFAGSDLERDDIGFLDADPNNNLKNNTVTNREQRAGDVTIWLRAGTQHETKSTGALGESESRFCYVTDGTGTRTQAPLYRFVHQDAKGWFVQPGDPAWSGGPGTACEQNLFNCVCGSCSGLFQKLWISGNRSGCTTHSGTQGGSAIKTGVVTVPSGHTFNAMVLSNIADFCVYLGNTCGSAVDSVKTVTYLWQVPVIGTVVRLQSAQDVPDPNGWTTVAETNILFGLFPPRSITATGSTNNTVSLSWDPGLDTHRISSYKIYWDTDSGSLNPYAFNSVANAGQVSFAGNTATISGLTPGTTYYFTVTSRSTYTDPSSSVVTTYESILYPTQVSGDPSFVYPTEVMRATTSPTCIPAAEVANVTVTMNPTSGIDICWDASTDPCLQGYEVLGAGSPTSDANFGVLADVGATTCWNGNPIQGFFLVTVRGTGGNGPWGAYGH